MFCCWIGAGPMTITPSGCGMAADDALLDGHRVVGGPCHSTAPLDPGDAPGAPRAATTAGHRHRSPPAASHGGEPGPDQRTTDGGHEVEPVPRPQRGVEVLGERDRPQHDDRRARPPPPARPGRPADRSDGSITRATARPMPTQPDQHEHRGDRARRRDAPAEVGPECLGQVGDQPMATCLAGASGSRSTAPPRPGHRARRPPAASPADHDGPRARPRSAPRPAG